MTNQKYLICDLYDYYSSQSLHSNILRNIIDFIQLKADFPRHTKILQGEPSHLRIALVLQELSIKGSQFPSKQEALFHQDKYQVHWVMSL